MLPDVTFLLDKSSLKMPKNDPFWRVFENLAVLTDRSLLKGQKKIAKIAKIYFEDFVHLDDFIFK